MVVCYLIIRLALVKTCILIVATASTFFEPQGYHILWVTRTTLKADIWKDMFDSIVMLLLKMKY